MTYRRTRPVLGPNHQAYQAGSPDGDASAGCQNVTIWYAHHPGQPADGGQLKAGGASVVVLPVGWSREGDRLRLNPASLRHSDSIRWPPTIISPVLVPSASWVPSDGGRSLIVRRTAEIVSHRRSTRRGHH